MFQKEYDLKFAATKNMAEVRRTDENFILLD